MRAALYTFVVSILVSCGPSTQSEESTAFEFDPAQCNPLCGNGIAYTVSAFSLPSVDENGHTVGFDLDGEDGHNEETDVGCNIDDYESPDGKTGIDNELATTLKIAEEAAEGQIDTLVGSSNETIADGSLFAVVQLVGADSPDYSGPVGVVIYRGQGIPIINAHGTVLSKQTVQVSDDILGHGTGWMENGSLKAEIDEFSMSFYVLGGEFPVRVEQVQVEAAVQADGTVEILLGGAVRNEVWVEFADRLRDNFGEDLATPIRVLPLYADIGLETESACDALSVAALIEAVPVHLFQAQ